jgi:hypothetical protein
MIWHGTRSSQSPPSAREHLALWPRRHGLQLRLCIWRRFLKAFQQYRESAGWHMTVTTMLIPRALSKPALSRQSAHTFPGLTARFLPLDLQRVRRTASLRTDRVRAWPRTRFVRNSTPRTRFVLNASLGSELPDATLVEASLVSLYTLTWTRFTRLDRHGLGACEQIAYALWPRPFLGRKGAVTI